MSKRRKTMRRVLLPALMGFVGGCLAIAGAASLNADRQVAAATSRNAQAAEGAETLRKFSAAFVAAAERVGPAVVSIVVEKHQENPFGGMSRPFEGTPFEFFWGPHGGPRGFQKEAPTITGGGTGIIIREDGMILTNNHVVEGADSIRVALTDGEEYDAEIKGLDPRTDLALIQIDADGLPTVTLGDSEGLQVGEWVVAVGNPYGFEHTVTAGIVSAKGRRVRGGMQYEDYIQTDASINPGNSGGPLLNLDGEVVGINTMIAGIGTGIGFAIPSDMVRSVSKQLMEKGKVVRPWMGIGIQNLTKPLAEKMDLDVEDGVLVNQVHEGTPAEKGGIKVGDVIVSVDGSPVKNSDELIKAVLSHEVGDTLKVRLIRDGRKKTIRVTTDEMPDEDTLLAQAGGMTSKSPAANIGIQVAPISEEQARRLGLRADVGLLITDVAPGSPAARADLRPGDVILEVNRTPVNSVAEFKAALGDGDDDTILLLIGRRGRTFFIPIEVK